MLFHQLLVVNPYTETNTQLIVSSKIKWIFLCEDFFTNPHTHSQTNQAWLKCGGKKFGTMIASLYWNRKSSKVLILDLCWRKLWGCPARHIQYKLSHKKPKSVLWTDVSVSLTDKPILSVVSTTSNFLRQRTKSVETIDYSVKATNKSVRRTVFGRSEHKPNILLEQ
jgi:hypothetical protein